MPVMQSASPAAELQDISYIGFELESEDPTGVDQITNDKSQMTNKVLRDGQLFIIRDGKFYNALGAEVR